MQSRIVQVALGSTLDSSDRGASARRHDQSLRFTSADLDLFPHNDGKRYEIIDGELYVSRQLSWEHQLICFGFRYALPDLFGRLP